MQLLILRENEKWISEHGGNAKFVLTDVSDEQVRAKFENAMDEF